MEILSRIVRFPKRREPVEVFYYKCSVCGKEIISVNPWQFKYNVQQHEQKHKKGEIKHGKS